MSIYQWGVGEYLAVARAALGVCVVHECRPGGPIAVIEQVAGDLWGEAMDHHDGCCHVWFGMLCVYLRVSEEVGDVEGGCQAVAVQQPDEVPRFLLHLPSPQHVPDFGGNG
jgi:hypothetical protein